MDYLSIPKLTLNIGDPFTIFIRAFSHARWEPMVVPTSNRLNTVAQRLETVFTFNSSNSSSTSR